MAGLNFADEREAEAFKYAISQKLKERIEKRQGIYVQSFNFDSILSDFKRFFRLKIFI